MNQMFESFETAAFIFFFLIVVFFIGWFVYHEFRDWFLARKQKPKYGGQIAPVKNPLPPPPELKNAMPRAVAPDAPKRFFGSDEEVEIVRKELEEHLRGMRYNLAGVRKIVFQNGSEMIIPTSALVKKTKGEYKQNDDGIVVWNTDEKSAPWVSVDFAPPLDPPTYTSDSGSSNSDSSPTDFSGGEFGGGGAGAEY